MTIRITHAAGVGDWPYGAVVELEDRRAIKLLHDGYAVQTDETAVKAKSKKRKD